MEQPVSRDSASTVVQPRAIQVKRSNSTAAVRALVTAKPWAASRIGCGDSGGMTGAADPLSVASSTVRVFMKDFMRTRRTTIVKKRHGSAYSAPLPSTCETIEIRMPDPREVPDEAPPFLKTWPRVYAAVLLYLAGLIAAFYLFSRSFR